MIYICLYNSPNYGGGAEQVVNNILQGFSSNLKNKIILICNDLNEDDIFYFNGIKCINLKTKRYSFLEKLFNISRFTFSYKIFKFIQKNVKDGDIVNFHGMEYSFFTSFFRKKINTNFKLIVTLHGSFYDAWNNYILKRLPLKFILLKIVAFPLQYFYYFMEKIASKNVDIIISITKYLENLYIKKYGFKNKIIIIPNGLKLEKKDNNKIEFNQPYKILIIGSTVYKKGLDIALKAIKNLNTTGYNINLSIIGFGDFLKNGLYSEKINYIGNVKHEKIEFFFNQNHIFLFPSRQEGLPLTLLEALQTETPIVCSDQSKFEEINGYEKYGYIVKGTNPIDYEKAIIKMLNKENYLTFKENIKKSLENGDFNKFDWKNIAKQYENLFLNNMKGKK